MDRVSATAVSWIREELPGRFAVDGDHRLRRHYALHALEDRRATTCAPDAIDELWQVYGDVYACRRRRLAQQERGGLGAYVFAVYFLLSWSSFEPFIEAAGHHGPPGWADDVRRALEVGRARRAAGSGHAPRRPVTPPPNGTATSGWREEDPRASSHSR